MRVIKGLGSSCMFKAHIITFCFSLDISFDANLVYVLQNLKEYTFCLSIYI